ncbi:MAG: hypothetical protein H7Y59_17490 [Anaerolineales bacterium]|nr:hypothetical protein [Anaerolineales bacterium]
MSHRLMFIFNAIAVAAFGVVFLAMPETLLNFFDTETYAATVFVARFMGAGLALAGVFIWFAKDMIEPQTERTMTIALLTSSAIGFVLTLYGMVFANVIRANGWILLVIHILFILGYVVLLFGITVTSNKNQPQQYKQTF